MKKSIIGQKNVWILIFVLLVLAIHIPIPADAVEDKVTVLLPSGALTTLQSTLTSAHAKAADIEGGGLRAGGRLVDYTEIETLQSAARAFTIREEDWKFEVFEDREITLTTAQAQLLDSVLLTQATGTDWENKLSYENPEGKTLTRTQLNALDAEDIARRAAESTLSSLPAGTLPGSADPGFNTEYSSEGAYCTV